MTYLFGQVWLWLVLAFLLGALVTWLVLRLFRKPSVQVSEERITAPGPKHAAVESVEAVEPTEAVEPAVAAATVPRDSALGTLDDQERTMALKSDTLADDNERTTALSQKEMFTDDTPTGRIPVQTEAPASGSMSGSLPDPAESAEPSVEVSDMDTPATGIPMMSALATPSAPATDAPTAEALTAEALTAEAPTAEASGADASTAEVPTADAPTADALTADAPAIEPIAADTLTDEAIAAESAPAVPEQAGSSENLASATVVPESKFGRNSAAPKPDGTAPSEDFTVKGNADSMLFHTTDSPYYSRTKAEVWFKEPADAEAAGFAAWNRRRTAKS
jgi:hypothetical protein